MHRTQHAQPRNPHTALQHTQLATTAATPATAATAATTATARARQAGFFEALGQGMASPDWSLTRLDADANGAGGGGSREGGGVESGGPRGGGGDKVRMS